MTVVYTTAYVCNGCVYNGGAQNLDEDGFEERERLLELLCHRPHLHPGTHLI